MDSNEELQKRVNDAGIRCLLTEIDAASSLLSKIARSPNPKERQKCRNEVRATLDFVSRIARSTEFSDRERCEIEDCMKELRHRLNQFSELHPEFPASGAPLRRTLPR